MVVNGEIKNNPNAELVEQGTEFDIYPVAGRDIDPPVGEGIAHSSPKRSKMIVYSTVSKRIKKIERAVANGMMMVVVQPRQLSPQFMEGNPVMVIAEGEVNVRLGPGTNYGIIAVLTPGSQGKILEHPLNGVLAKDMYWWKIMFGEVIGWISEEYLALSSIP